MKSSGNMHETLQRGATAEDGVGWRAVLGKPTGSFFLTDFFVMHILPQFLKSRKPPHFTNMILSNRINLIIM